MMLWQSLTSRRWCHHVDRRWWAVTFVIFWQYGPCGVYSGTRGHGCFSIPPLVLWWLLGMLLVEVQGYGRNQWCGHESSGNTLLYRHLERSTISKGWKVLDVKAVVVEPLHHLWVLWFFCMFYSHHLLRHAKHLMCNSLMWHDSNLVDEVHCLE